MKLLGMALSLPGSSIGLTSSRVFHCGTDFLLASSSHGDDRLILWCVLGPVGLLLFIYGLRWLGYLAKTVWKSKTCLVYMCPFWKFHYTCIGC